MEEAERRAEAAEKRAAEAEKRAAEAEKKTVIETKRAEAAEKIKEDGRNVRKMKIEELQKEVDAWKGIADSMKQAAAHWQQLYEAKNAKP